MPSGWLLCCRRGDFCGVGFDFRIFVHLLVACALKRIAQGVAKRHSEDNENHRANEIKAEKDEKHSFRYDLLVAAFTVALTLFLEHLHDVAEFALELFHSLP